MGGEGGSEPVHRPARHHDRLGRDSRDQPRAVDPGGECRLALPDRYRREECVHYEEPEAEGEPPQDGSNRMTAGDQGRLGGDHARCRDEGEKPWRSLVIEKVFGNPLREADDAQER